MIQGIQTQPQPDNAGGLVTLPSLLNLPQNTSPNCLDIEFGIGGAFGKRYGVSSTNSVALDNTAGWASFDFGASALRWHVVAAGTGIYASSNRGTSYVAVATDRSQYFQRFERSKNVLIATSETHNRVMYWAGSVGTFFLAMPVGSAPAAKIALDFAGYLMLMNNSGGSSRVIYYADNNNIATDPWTSTFEVGSSVDDEITDAITYNTRAYVFTKYTTHQISHVGGNPDFAVRGSWMSRPSWTCWGETRRCGCSMGRRSRSSPPIWSRITPSPRRTSTTSMSSTSISATLPWTP